MNTKDQLERYIKEDKEDLSSDQLEMYIQEDKEIRDLLIQESVIDDHRIKRCCKFSNTERNTRPNQPIRSYPTYCERYECRFCRRKIIDTHRKNHYRNNIEFLENNDQSSIIMFTLTVPHTKKDTLPSIHDRFKKSMTNMKHSYPWKKIKEMTNYKFHYTNYELTETRDSGYHFHSHIIYGVQSNDVSLSTIEDVLYDSWCFESMKMNFKKPRRKRVRVTVPENITYSDKSIEELSKIPGTREFHEKEFKETYESPSSKFRTKKLKEIGDEIKTINTTFSKRTRRGRVYF